MNGSIISDREYKFIKSANNKKIENRKGIKKVIVNYISFF